MNQQAPEAFAGRAFMRINYLSKALGLSVRTIQRRVKDGTFPAPIRLSENAIAWLSADVQAWIESRKATKH